MQAIDSTGAIVGHFADQWVHFWKCLHLDCWPLAINSLSNGRGLTPCKYPHDAEVLLCRLCKQGIILWADPIFINLPFGPLFTEYPSYHLWLSASTCTLLFTVIALPRHLDAAMLMTPSRTPATARKLKSISIITCQKAQVEMESPSGEVDWSQPHRSPQKYTSNVRTLKLKWFYIILQGYSCSKLFYFLDQLGEWRSGEWVNNLFMLYKSNELLKEPSS